MTRMRIIIDGMDTTEASWVLRPALDRMLTAEGINPDEVTEITLTTVKEMTVKTFDGVVINGFLKPGTFDLRGAVAS